MYAIPLPKNQDFGFFVTALLCWLMFMLRFTMTLTFSFLLLHLCVSVCFQSILFSLVISSSECTKFFGFKSSSYFPVWRFFPPLYPCSFFCCYVKDNTQKTKKLPDIQKRQRSQEHTKQTGWKKRKFFFSGGNFNWILKNSGGNRYQTYNFQEMKCKLRKHIKKNPKTEPPQDGRHY